MRAKKSREMEETKEPSIREDLHKELPKCFRRAKGTLTNDKKRTALAPVDLNVEQVPNAIPPPPPHVQAFSVVLKKLTITCKRDLSHWQPNKKVLLSSFQQRLTDQRQYYQFPFPSIKKEHHTRLHRLLLAGRHRETDAFENVHFNELLECWRRALLSLYESLKSGAMEYFYHIQPEFVILFRKQDCKINAVIAASKSVPIAKQLGKEGITAFPITAEGQKNADVALESLRPGDENTESPLAIRSEINERLNELRRKRATSQATGSNIFEVSGEGMVHLLVDFLLNQPDGRSYVVFPELLAPGPFQFGTLMRTEMQVQGPLASGDWQVQLSGRILPGLTLLVLEQVAGEHDISIVQKTDESTENLGQQPFHI